MEQSQEVENLSNKESLLQSTQRLYHLVQQLRFDLTTEQCMNLSQKILEARFEVITLMSLYGQSNKPFETDAKS